MLSVPTLLTLALANCSGYIQLKSKKYFLLTTMVTKDTMVWLFFLSEKLCAPCGKK
jgi:hypothetical protein